MFKDRFTLLLETLTVKNTVIADYAGTNHTALSHYKSGQRIPDRNGSAIHALVDGIVRYANEQNKTDRLYRLLEENSFPADETNLSEQLWEWLYADTPTPIHARPRKKKNVPPASTFSSFGERLSDVMDLAGLSNAGLARLINIDSSQISRYRNGHRTPKNNMGIVISICQVLIEHIGLTGNTRELVKMTGAPTQALTDEDMLFIYLRNWLCDFEPDDITSIGQLLQHMNTFTPISSNHLPSFESIATGDVLNDTATYYRGNSGLQNAVIRFLSTVITNGARELLLYSDQSMDWLTGNKEFQIKWTALMTECVKQGIRIKIIHNIERNTGEMVEAIRNWLPLYMSGMIEPYYCTLKNGQRFSHTIFLCPGVACVEASVMNGGDEYGIYHYHTAADMIGCHERGFRSLLERCKVLVRIQTERPSGSTGTTFSTEEYGNILITIKKASVVVSRTESPCMSFVFMHPLMYEAFLAFVKREK